jgi:hypothetical protein
MQWFAELSKSQRCGNDAQPADPRWCLCDELVAMPAAVTHQS